ncbi:hypothetical protein [Microbacterium sp. JZ31]|uniref:hypothetical protein n=1 Tax=Microbacterium sp. JZ31 TaxID=1906274 RepID=UPI00193365DB|nr:hypothetical protein [Microbacterium sp. JZ31]
MRKPSRDAGEDFNRDLRRHRRAAPDRAPPVPRTESPVLDLIYVAATLALFALVALVVKGAEKL